VLQKFGFKGQQGLWRHPKRGYRSWVDRRRAKHV